MSPTQVLDRISVQLKMLIPEVAYLVEHVYVSFIHSYLMTNDNRGSPESKPQILIQLLHLLVDLIKRLRSGRAGGILVELLHEELLPPDALGQQLRQCSSSVPPEIGARVPIEFRGRTAIASRDGAPGPRAVVPKVAVVSRWAVALFPEQRVAISILQLEAVLLQDLQLALLSFEDFEVQNVELLAEQGDRIVLARLVNLHQRRLVRPRRDALVKNLRKVIGVRKRVFELGVLAAPVSRGVVLVGPVLQSCCYVVEAKSKKMFR